jgi:hypothetical protein
MIVVALFHQSPLGHGTNMGLLLKSSGKSQREQAMVAGEDIKQDILKAGIRKHERETGVSHHTINRILKGENVRRTTLAKVIKEIKM